MIPCQECGHINRLGAIYCGACGAKLTVDVADIEQSVVRTAANQRADKIMVMGRNTMVIGVFLFVATWVLGSVVIPPMPAVVAPTGPLFEPAELLDPQAEWITPHIAGDNPRDLEALAEIKQEPLRRWRALNQTQLMTGLDLDQITNWQIEVFNSRNSDGYWSGGDPVAATGLALLALMAKPGPSDFEQAIASGADYLKGQVLRGSSGRSSLAHTIGIMALVESGTLTANEQASLSMHLARGDAPNWQAMALISFSPEQRPARIAAMRANTDASLWRHFLHFLSAQPMIEEVDNALFAPGAGEAFTGIDRWAWACLSLWMGRNAPDFKDHLQRWSQAEEPPPVSAELQDLIGGHAELCMAILVTCTPLRAPAPWIVRPTLNR